VAYLEDATVGQKARFGRYEVTRDEVIDFASKYDPQPFHLDDEAAKHSIFGKVAASGWHTCAMMMRMIVDNLGEGGSLGGIGMDELRWLKPVYPGDVLSCESEIMEVVPSRSKPDRGVVKTRLTILNQNDEPVMVSTNIALSKRRPA
jgi:acyl dehydratase